MLTTNGSAIDLSFQLPAGASAKRWRAVVNAAYSEWRTTGIVSGEPAADGTIPVKVTIPAEMNTIDDTGVIGIVSVELDVGIDILVQNYGLVTSNPLQCMVNSFVTMPEAISIAAARNDMQNFIGATFEDKIYRLNAAWSALISYRYFIFFERNDWGGKQYAGYGLPYLDDYQQVNYLYSMSADDFNSLKPDFIRRMKLAQLLAADDAIASESNTSPTASDPDLIMEKIADTTRQWRQSRNPVPTVGRRAVRMLSAYLSSPQRLTRS